MGAGELAAKKCKPCEGGVRPMSAAQANAVLGEIPEWELEGNTKIRRKFKFDDFRQAQSWLNRVADIAEDEGHHPDIYWSYSKVTVELTTHSIGGLSENDFILAAKVRMLDGREQQHARKYHSYYWVFEKRASRVCYGAPKLIT